MLRSALSESLKCAMKEKNKRAVSTIRLILAALKDRDIAARGKGNAEGIDEHEILEVLQKMVRQRRESIETYKKGGRADLAQQEAEEIEIIREFLPKQLDEEATRGAVDAVIGELEASTLKDMGRTMATLKERYAGRMDFGLASAMVKDQLT